MKPVLYYTTTSSIRMVDHLYKLNLKHRFTLDILDDEEIDYMPEKPSSSIKEGGSIKRLQ
jgi:hypothetical protein